MKRARSNDAEHAVKRARNDYAPSLENAFPAGLLQSALDVSQNGVDETGYVNGRVHMRWPWIGKKCKMIFYAEDARGIPQHKIHVQFSQSCVEPNFKELLSFDIGDELQLHLRGAKAEKKEIPGTTLPLQLTYEEGVTFRYKSRKNKTADNGQTIDIWALREYLNRAGQEDLPADSVDPDDWYSTPAPPDYAAFVGEAEERPSSTAPTANLSVKPTPSPAVPAPKATSSRLVQHGPDFFDEIPGPSSHPNMLEKRQQAKAALRKTREIPPAKNELDRAGARSNQHVKSKQTEQVGKALPLPQALPESASSVTSSVRSVPPTVEQPPVRVDGPKKKLSKREKKELKKEKRRAEQATTAVLSDEPAPAVATPKPAEGAVPPLCSVASSSEPPTASMAETVHQILFNSISSGAVASSSKFDDSISTPTNIAHQLQQTHLYPQMNTLGHMTQKRVNLIGVVACVQEPKTVIGREATDKWSKVLRIVDRTVFDARDVAALERGTAGFAITCFTRQYTEWLPQVKQGDILILRNVVVEYFNHECRGTVYADCLQWSVYNSSRRSFVDAGKSLPPSVPRRAFMAAEGDGVDHTPFFHLDADCTETDMAQSLRSWWTDVLQEMVKNRGAIHQIGAPAESISVGGGRMGREHRLLENCKPSMPPRGFFDATVKVLESRSGGPNQPWHIYVTDYTSVSGAYTIREGWCPEALSNYVLKVELWDSACLLGETIHRGDFLALNNARMVGKASGYVEAKVQEGKKLRILKEEEADENAYLAELLKRQMAWRESDGATQWPCLLLKDVTDETSFFQTLLEIRHVDEATKDRYAVVYGTDYTSNTTLPPVPAAHTYASWAQSLSDRILQISVKPEQEKHLHCLKPGTFFLFNNLRMKRLQLMMGGVWAAEFGGLFDKLNDRRPRQELQALLQRKQEWQASSSAEGPTEDNQKGHVNASPKERKAANGSSKVVLRLPQSQQMRISDAMALPCPSKFRMRARVVGMYPSKLEECAVEQCTSCHKILARQFKLCHDCMEMSDTPAHPMFHFFLRFEDESGWSMDVFVTSNQKCSLLAGLDPKLMDNENAVGAFRKRMRRYVANIHQLDDESTEMDGTKNPLLDLTVHSWAPEGMDMDSDRIFELVNMELA